MNEDSVRTYAAACSLDGEVIRLVIFAADRDVDAEVELLRSDPSVANASHTIHTLPNGVAVALDLKPGQSQVWWRG